MRLLFLSPVYPLPADSGQKMRIWAMLRALAALGHEVTLLTFRDPAQESPALGAVCRVVDVPCSLARQSAGKDYLGRARSLFSRLPFGVRRFRHPDLRTRLEAELRTLPYDAALCMSAFVAVNLPRSSPVPWIVDNANVEHLLLRRYVAFERNPLKRAYAVLEARRLRAWEAYVNGRARLSLVCSEQDRAVLRELCPRQDPVVVPNVVDLETYPPPSAGQPNTVVFTGAVDWIPNQDAVAFFVHQVLPELRRLVPEVVFVVAGRVPSESYCRRYARYPVRFTGRVPDMSAELAKASVCVVPLRIGGGTRLKILEAAAMAKPVVSTRLGAEGLDFADGSEIALEDDPRRFARAVAELLNDPARRSMMGQAARGRVERQYAFPVLRSTLGRALEEFERGLETAP